LKGEGKKQKGKSGQIDQRTDPARRLKVTARIITSGRGVCGRVTVVAKFLIRGADIVIDGR